MDLHSEKLAGRTQQVYFSPEEAENYTYSFAQDVDFFDARICKFTSVLHRTNLPCLQYEVHL